MRSWKLFLLIIIAAVLQLSFLGAIRPFGVTPNLLLVVVIYAGLICTASQTVSSALLGGLLLDGASGVDFGLRTTFYVFLALAIVVIKRAGADFGNTAMITAATLSATLFYNAAIVASLTPTFGDILWLGLGRIILAEAGLNVLLAIALRAPLAWWMSTASLMPRLGGK